MRSGAAVHRVLLRKLAPSVEASGIKISSRYRGVGGTSRLVYMGAVREPALKRYARYVVEDLNHAGGHFGHLEFAHTPGCPLASHPHPGDASRGRSLCGGPNRPPREPPVTRYCPIPSAC
jgi:hypothetical protein